MLRVQTGIGLHEGFKASQHSLDEMLKVHKCYDSLGRKSPASPVGVREIGARVVLLPFGDSRPVQLPGGTSQHLDGNLQSRFLHFRFL